MCSALGEQQPTLPMMFDCAYSDVLEAPSVSLVAKSIQNKNNRDEASQVKLLASECQTSGIYAKRASAGIKKTQQLACVF
jgi:hypothetical protein